MDCSYLDNSATTPVYPEVADLMKTVMVEAFGNPSSLHGKGREAERLLNQARERVARVLGTNSRDIIFTSGGTEASNLAIKGAARAYRKRGSHLVTTRIEHPATLRAVEELEAEGFVVTYLGVDGEGMVAPADLEAAITDETILVSTMYVNHEVGAIQPLGEFSRILKSRGRRPFWHVDGVQAFAKLEVEPYKLGIDLFSLSAHKIHGPKGAGALFVREGVRLKPLLVGGGQEAGIRSGTENMPGISGLGLAAEICWEKSREGMNHLADLKQFMIERVLEDIPDAQVNGPGDKRAAPYITNFRFKGIKGEVLVHALEEHGIYVSTGSACSSRQHQASYVLEAMGVPDREAEGAIRVSFSTLTGREDVERIVAALPGEIKELRKFSRVR